MLQPVNQIMLETVKPIPLLYFPKKFLTMSNKLYKMQDKVFDVAAEVIDVLDEYGWYYDACPTHKTRIRSTKPYYYCPQCTTKVEQPQPW